jgi:NADH:ubiquinone oxidoreductase subunit 6 (subunit J)
MKNFHTSSVLKGGFLGLVAGLIFIPIYLPLHDMPLEALSVAAFPFFLFVGSGLVLGYFSGRLHEKRYKKLLLHSLVIYVFDSFIVSVVIVFNDSPNNSTFLSNLYNSIWLGLVGSLIFGMFLLPIIAALVYLLERWTRSTIHSPEF